MPAGSPWDNFVVKIDRTTTIDRKQLVVRTEDTGLRYFARWISQSVWEVHTIYEEQVSLMQLPCSGCPLQGTAHMHSGFFL